MKSKRTLKLLAGAAVFLAVVGLSVWFLKPATAPAAREINLDAALAKIDNREVKEVLLKADRIELTILDGQKYFANVGSDATREQLINTIVKYNDHNTAAPIKLTEEPASSGWGLIFLINALPVLLVLLMVCSVTLASIIYIVKTLTGNKS